MEDHGWDPGGPLEPGSPLGAAGPTPARQLVGLEQAPTVNRDLSIRRVRERIDRALDCGNRRQFIELCRLLRDYQAQGSRAPDTP
jgi:hypothetical protein